jgi:hypothetical protein
MREVSFSSFSSSSRCDVKNEGGGRLVRREIGPRVYLN